MNVVQVYGVVAFLTGVLLGVAGQECKAAEPGPNLSLNVLVGSHHWTGSEPNKYNEENPGLGLQLDLPNGARYGVMRFKNSYYDMATALYMGANYMDSKYVDLGVDMMFVHGYGDHLDFPLVPALTADVHLADTVDVFFKGMPGAVVGFGLTWDF